MDPHRFDRLARTVSTTGTRRGLLRLLAAVPVVGTVVTLREPAATRGKRKKGGSKTKNTNTNDNGASGDDSTSTTTNTNTNEGTYTNTTTSTSTDPGRPPTSCAA